MLKEIENELDSLLIADDAVRSKISDFFKKDVVAYLEFLSYFETKIKEDKNDLDESQKIINNATYQIAKKGYELENLIKHKPLVEEIKDIFRKLIIRWMGKSIIVKHALEKPRGYSGDYKALEYIYENKPVSAGIGYYFDRGFLECELCAAVRNRKDKMAELIKQFVVESDASEINILNLACGSCREIEKFAQSVSLNDPLNFVCVDHDQMSLDYAQNNLKNINKIRASFVKEDIISAVRSGASELFNGKNLIYSIGLIDYLPDRVLKKLIWLCYDGLETGGRLVVSHKDRDKYIPMREDWLTDWKFVPRNEEKLLAIIADAGISRANIKVVREHSQIILFLIISK